MGGASTMHYFFCSSLPRGHMCVLRRRRIAAPASRSRGLHRSVRVRGDIRAADSLSQTGLRACRPTYHPLPLLTALHFFPSTKLLTSELWPAQVPLEVLVILLCPGWHEKAEILCAAEDVTQVRSGARSLVLASHRPHTVLTLADLRLDSPQEQVVSTAKDLWEKALATQAGEGGQEGGSSGAPEAEASQPEAPQSVPKNVRGVAPCLSCILSAARTISVAIPPRYYGTPNRCQSVWTWWSIAKRRSSSCLRPAPSSARPE